MKRLLVCQECRHQWDVTPYGVGQKIRCTCGFLMQVPAVKSHAPHVQHCESCGAPRKPTQEACSYCGAVPTRLSSKMNLVCPFCMCRTADDSKHCQSCGRALAPSTLDATTGKVVCPHCTRTRLICRTIGEFPVDECPSCGGMWIDLSVFERIVNQQAKEREERLYSHSVKSTRVRPDAASVVYLKCPSCRRHMNRRNFARASGVIIDECREHGIWLDADELEKIAAYVASGGLRKTKRIEVQELEDRAKRAEKVAGAGAAMGGMAPAGPSPIFSSRDLPSSSSTLLEVLGFFGDLFKD